MAKQIIVYFVVIAVVFFGAFYAHDSIVNRNDSQVIYFLQAVYWFHAIFSLLICVLFKLLSLSEKYFYQLGFIYLGSLLVKLAIFFLIFYEPVLTNKNITKIEAISLLIPLGLSLILEVYFLAKILNKK